MTVKILLIEDDDSICTTIGLFFKVVMPEAQFLDTHLGKSGIDIIFKEQPDIILLDLGLPDISGFEVIRRVRERFKIPIIVLTARKEPGTEERCYALGANDFIPKPFRHRDLVEGINKLLSHRGTRVKNSV